MPELWTSDVCTRVGGWHCGAMPGLWNGRKSSAADVEHQPVEQTPESFFAALQTESTNTAPQHDRTPQYESNEYVARRKVQTIQQTGKFWKSLQALGVLGILGAVTWGMIAQDANTTAMCILVSVPSFVLYVVGRVGAWWFHG